MRGFVVLPEYVVVEVIEAGHGNEAAHATAQRVEDLCGCISPHLCAHIYTWPFIMQSSTMETKVFL